VKELRSIFLKFIAGDPVRVSASRIAIQKDGLPKLFSPLRLEILSSNPIVIRCLLTSLSVTRGITGDGIKVDISPISEPNTHVPSEEFMAFIRASDVSFGVDSYYTSGEWTDYHYSTKSGPNGLALASSLIDLRVLSERFPSLLQDILTLSGNDTIKERVEPLLVLANTTPLPTRIVDGEEVEKELYVRKLAVIPDSEGKNRVVAILDYWSQTVLFPLHQGVLKILERIPQDRTFSQNPLGLRQSGSFFSFDLKNATDRFPILYQKLVVERLIGVERAQAWHDLLVKEEFHYKGRTVAYASGQPMGAYSSWAVFTLTHHLLVQFCLLKAGLPEKDPCYMILGDDIVISDTKVAEYYQAMLKSLGVEISGSKTLISSDTFEFAKRLIHRGIEVSPFPVVDVEQHKSRPESLGYVIYSARKKGWLLTNSYHGIPDLNLLFTFLRYLGYGKRSIQRCAPTLYFSYLMHFLNDNFSLDPTVVRFPSVQFASDTASRLFNQNSCVKDSHSFLKDIIYPQILEAKAHKLRTARLRCSALDQEASVKFASLMSSLPNEVLDQVPASQLAEIWPVSVIIHRMSIVLNDAIATAHMVEMTSPKDIMAFGSDIALPDVGKYSSLRKHDIQIASDASLFRSVFKQCTQVYDFTS